MGNAFRPHSDDDMFFSFSEIKKESKKYKGWDWAEVYAELGLDMESPDIVGEVNMDSIVARDKVLYARLIDLLETSRKESPPWGDGMSDLSKKALLACRAYVYAAATLNNARTYLQPLWMGLAQVRSDEEFIKMYIVLFPYIWD